MTNTLYNFRLLSDNFESNNTQSTATSLGSISQSWSNLTIDSSTDEDWFKITLPATGTSSNYVKINFPGSSGDIDLELYQADGTYITNSAGTGDEELISLEGLAAGNYSVKVYGYDGATNTYSLQTSLPTATITDDHFESNNTQSTATSLGSISQSWSNLTIDSSTDEDWFKITLPATGTSSNYVKINFPGSSGDIDLELYQADGTYITNSAGTGDEELISLEGLAAGNYSVKVYGCDGATNTYSLQTSLPTATITDDHFEPNNTQSTAKDLGLISGIGEWENLSITSGDQDWFKFTLATAGNETNSVGINFTNIQGDLDIGLYDSNGNFLNSSTGTDNQETIFLEGLTAGSYYLQVYGWLGAVSPDYSLFIN